MISPVLRTLLERLVDQAFYCFLDGYSGYNKILFNLEDQEKTTFTYPFGVFSYWRMPFGACNALATFQRGMNSIFYDMVEKLMQSYPPRVLDRRHQEAWARTTNEGPRVLMNLMIDF